MKINTYISLIREEKKKQIFRAVGINSLGHITTVIMANNLPDDLIVLHLSPELSCSNVTLPQSGAIDLTEILQVLKIGRSPT